MRKSRFTEEQIIGTLREHEAGGKTTSGTTTLVSSVTYAPFGPLTRAVYGNGTTKTVTFDARYRILENKLVGPSGTIADSTYASDAVGNITQIHDALDGSFNRDFAYDDLNRLITANSGSSLWATVRISTMRWGTCSRRRSERCSRRPSPMSDRRRS